MHCTPFCGIRLRLPARMPVTLWCTGGEKIRWMQWDLVLPCDAPLVYVLLYSYFLLLNPSLPGVRSIH
jgi:hypothetical protein